MIKRESEAIIVIVGFLGSGKTTLLRKLVSEYLEEKWNPFVILNDYENAIIDAQGFLNLLGPKQINALSGSCICCSGIDELRERVNITPARVNPITLIEANGTTDAVSLMGFLGVGMEKHFLPPVQIAVVDVRNWQKRAEHNELEANQVQVSSLIVLNYVSEVDVERVVQVEQDLRNMNMSATIIHWKDFTINSLVGINPSTNNASKMDHGHAHWSSCSIDLPDPISSERLTKIIDNISPTILRVKGCTRIDEQEHYSHFERVPTGEVRVRPFNGIPVTGPKLLTIGPGSNPSLLQELVQKT